MGVSARPSRIIEKRSCQRSHLPTEYDRTSALPPGAHMGRSTIGFVRIVYSTPSSLGSGTLIRFGSVVGILTCAHVLEALLKEQEIGILCYPVRAAQIQTLRLPMAATDSVSIGAAPWNDRGPDLAFLKLPSPTISDLDRV
jgi:hypothetical protein